MTGNRRLGNTNVHFFKEPVMLEKKQGDSDVTEPEAAQNAKGWTRRNSQTV